MTTYYVNVKQYFQIEKLAQKLGRNPNYLLNSTEGWKLLQTMKTAFNLPEEDLQKVLTRDFPSNFEVLDFGNIEGNIQSVLPSHKGDCREILYISKENYLKLTELLGDFLEIFEELWDEESLDTFWYARYQTTLTTSYREILKSILKQEVFVIDTENFHNEKYVEAHLMHRIQFESLEKVLGEYLKSISHYTLEETVLEKSRYMIGRIILSELEKE